MEGFVIAREWNDRGNRDDESKPMIEIATPPDYIGMARNDN